MVQYNNTCWLSACWLFIGNHQWKIGFISVLTAEESETFVLDLGVPPYSANHAKYFYVVGVCFVAEQLSNGHTSWFAKYSPLVLQ